MALKLNIAFFNKENAWALKPIAICIVIIFIAVGITAHFTAKEQMKQTQQTEEYRMALDYLQSQPFIIDKYGFESPTFMGRTYQEPEGAPKRYVFSFVYHYVPVLNLGERYDVELNLIDGQWVVIGIID